MKVLYGTTSYTQSYLNHKAPTPLTVLKTAVLGLFLAGKNSPSPLAPLAALAINALPFASALNPRISEPVTVSTYVTGPLGASDFCETTSGNVVHVWVDNLTLQRSVRTLSGTELLPQTTLTTLSLDTPLKVQSLTGGGYIVIWVENAKVVFQKFSASHNPVGSKTEAFPDIPGNQFDPDTTQLTGGRIVLSCSHDQFPTALNQTGLGIVYQGFDADMNASLPSYQGTCYNNNQGPHWHGRIEWTIYGGFECNFFAATPDLPVRQRINNVGQKNGGSSPIPINQTTTQTHPMLGRKAALGYTHAWAVVAPDDSVTEFKFATFTEAGVRVSANDSTIPSSDLYWPNNATYSPNYLQVVDDPQSGFVIITREGDAIIQRIFHENTTQNGAPLNLANTSLQASAHPLGDGWGVIITQVNQILFRSFLYTTFQPTPSPTSEPTAFPTLEPTPLPTLEPTSTPTPFPTPYPTNPPTPLPTLKETSEPTYEPSPAPTNPTTSVKALQEPKEDSPWPIIAGAIAFLGASVSMLAAFVFYKKSTPPPSPAPINQKRLTAIHVEWDEETPPQYDRVPSPAPSSKGLPTLDTLKDQSLDTFGFPE